MKMNVELEMAMKMFKDLSENDYKIISYVLDNLDGSGRITLNQKEISVMSGISQVAVNRAFVKFMRKINENGDSIVPILIKLRNGSYRINPELIGLTEEENGIPHYEEVNGKFLFEEKDIINSGWRFDENLRVLMDDRGALIRDSIVKTRNGNLVYC